MAQFTGIAIDIDGTQVKQFTSFTLSQDIFDHHRFRLVCPAESLDGTSGNLFHSSKNLIGAAIKVKLEAIGNNGAMYFNGMVTRMTASRRNGYAGDIIIDGASPTILLDNGPHCKTWEKKNIKNIAEDVLKHFPQNLLQPGISPVYTETLSYTVQYKETAWQFLCRLAADHGEWLFYDGQKLFLGPPGGNPVKLVYGSHLTEFDIQLQLQAPDFTMMAYDYMNHEVYDGAPKGVAEKAGLNDLGKFVLQKSEQFYATQPRLWYNQFLTNKKQLDDVVNTRAAIRSSHLLRFTGKSGHPDVQIGAEVSVEGKNAFSLAEESYGEYIVTSVTHQCDGQGNYVNDFTAIPSSVKLPPIHQFDEPRCETQSALVTDNNDPDGLGRVRVKFHWMNGAEKSPWMRVTTPHAGSGKGMFFMPETGEEVIVGFEGDSATKPYVIGSVFHGKAKNSFANGGNDVKTFQSRSGNKMVLDDKEGSVTVEDKEGNSMAMDGKGNVQVVSKESIVLSCGDASIELKKDGTITIAGKEVTSSASGTAVMVSGGASFSASSSGNEASMSGTKANINGDAEATVNGGGKATLSAGGKVSLQGAIVALN